MLMTMVKFVGQCHLKLIWNVLSAMSKLNSLLSASDRQLPTKVTTPLSSAYCLERDTSAKLDGDAQTYYQGLIGILQWIVNLVVLTFCSLFPWCASRYLVFARTGHLNQLFHIFAYPKKHNRSTLVFGDALPTLDDSVFKSSDWSEYYPEAVEAIPPNASPSRGQVYLSIVLLMPTMLVVIWLVGRIPACSFSWIVLLFSGSANIRIRLNPPLLGLSLLPCVLPLKWLRVCVTNYEWWVYLLTVLVTPFAIMLPPLLFPQLLNLH